MEDSWSAEPSRKNAERNARDKKGILVGLVLCCALIAVGLFQGDFGEIFRNGTTL